MADGSSFPKCLLTQFCHSTCVSKCSAAGVGRGGSCSMVLLLAAAAGLGSRSSAQELSAHWRCSLSFSLQAAPQTTGSRAGGGVAGATSPSWSGQGGPIPVQLTVPSRPSCSVSPYPCSSIPDDRASSPQPGPLLGARVAFLRSSCGSRGPMAAAGRSCG